MAASPKRFGVGHGTERITALSDGVFAIAITLLVLDLKLPDLPEHVTAAELTDALLDLWPRLFSFVLSFLVIGIFWINHHHLFAFIERYDTRLLWLNLLVLLFVSFLPFPTVVLGTHGSLAPAVILYAATMTLLGASQTVLWLYASRGRRLVDPAIDPRIVDLLTSRGVGATLVWLLSIPLALVDATLAMFSWLLIGVAQQALVRLFYRQQEAEEQSLQTTER